MAPSDKPEYEEAEGARSRTFSALARNAAM
jgi:hypothetical protein